MDNYKLYANLISDVYKLYQELRSIGVPEIRYLIMKDGQEIGGSPVYGFNGFYCLENSADLWFVYYQNQSVSPHSVAYGSYMR